MNLFGRVLDAALKPLQPLLRSGKTRAVTISVLAVLLSGVALYLPLTRPALIASEFWTRDIRLHYGPPSPGPDPHILVVAITEDVLDAFPYRSPIDRAFLADLLEKLAAKHARAIGVDVLFDRPTEPEKDERLRQTLRALPVPTVVSFVEDPHLMDEGGLAYLRNFVPPEMRVMANLAGEDTAGIFRAIYPGETDDQGAYIPGFARGLVAKLGIETPAEETPLRYRLRTADGDPPFTEVPANTVDVLPESLIAGKIVLVGADLTLIDRHLTPFVRTADNLSNGDANMAGVLIHAHSVAQLLDGHGLRDTAGWGILISFGLALAGTAVGRAGLSMAGRLAAAGAIMVSYWLIAFIVYAGTEVFLPMALPTLVLMVATWLTDVVVGREMREQKQFIQNAMARFVSGQVVQELLRDPSRLSVTADRRQMTYLFTDVAGFTTLAESVTSDRLSALLNEYLEGLCDVILASEGTVCRFIGDAVFALWGAPITQTDHAARAVRCAVAIDRYAEEFRAAKALEGLSFGATRIGVHSGEAMVGNFGSSKRMEYTALGDNVNLSSRLESLNKFFGTRVAVSLAAAEQVADVPFRPIGNVVVKGKTQPVEILEPTPAAALDSGFVARYRAAYDLMATDSPEARAAFERLAEEAPQDSLVRFHLHRLERGETGALIVLHEK